MTFPVVTFSVQAGSMGFTLARAVAASMRYFYYDWQITAKATALEGVNPDTRATGFAERILQRLMAAAVLEEELPAVMIAPSPDLQAQALQMLAVDSYRNEIEEVVRELAERGGAVIVGHGSQVVLKDWTATLKVLVLESSHGRAERLAAQQGTNLKDALRVIRELDDLKAAFFRRVYGVNWLDASLYDLVLNMDRISSSSALSMILEAATGNELDASTGPAEGNGLLKLRRSPIGRAA